jgi:hypothetical protein
MALGSVVLEDSSCFTDLGSVLEDSSFTDLGFVDLEDSSCFTDLGSVPEMASLTALGSVDLKDSSCSIDLGSVLEDSSFTDLGSVVLEEFIGCIEACLSMSLSIVKKADYFADCWCRAHTCWTKASTNFLASFEV